MTLFSLVALTHRINGSSRATEVSNQLFGSPNAGLRHDFPSHLEEFCRRTGGTYGDSIVLANTTTVLPYFLQFRSEGNSSEAYGLMCGKTVERLKFILGLPAGPSGATLPLRYCVECASDDSRKYGTAYWHRKHQLPGGFSCPVHNIQLLECQTRLDGRGRSELFLPGDQGTRPTRLDIPQRAGEELLLRLTALSVEALEHSPIENFDYGCLQGAYAHGLKQQGLLTPSGRIRAAEFLTRFEQRFRPISNILPFGNVVSPAQVDGMLRLVRKPRGNIHTLCHLLLIDFLFGSWSLFMTTYRWERQLELPFADIGGLSDDLPLESNDAIPPPELRTKLEQLVARLRQGNESFTSVANSLDLDIGTAMRWTGRLGLMEVPRRPRILTAELRATATQSMLEGIPLKDIANATGLSRSTIDRICNEHPGLSQKWRVANVEWKRANEREKLEQFLRSKPGATMKEFRDTSGSGFSWLCRNDPAWLKGKVPGKPPERMQSGRSRKPRVDWTSRDQECLTALKALPPTLILERWERHRPRAILRHLPTLSFTPRIARLPQSAAYIQQLLSRLARARRR